MSRDALVELAYLVAMILFSLGIKRMSKVRTARGGNLLSGLGMLIAIVATMVHYNHVYDYRWIVGGLIAGTVVGAFAAIRVPMTDMPEMVALFNGSGGAGSLLVALAVMVPALWPSHGHPSTWAKGLTMAHVTFNGGVGPDIALTLLLSVIVGGVTLVGSVVAYAKLAGRITGDAVVFPGQHILNLALLAVTAGLSIWVCFVIKEPGPAVWAVPVVAGISLLLGVLLVIPIGGADMPVVISLLNSYSGIAAAMTGFVLKTNVLIVSGALVGASGLILTNIMCKAMNRSLLSVLMGGFGQTAGAVDKKGARDYSNIRSITGEELAMMLEGVSSVIFVPGYGLAVAQAQHAVKELADLLQKREVEVRYAIHPVAGRMPGHMNVLLAESNVPYEQLVEMDDINSDFKTTDMVIVLGANDVVNPAALDDPTSPLAGMPILLVHEARNVVVVKRSLSPGYAGVKNTLFERDNCVMLFSDAKVALQETINELKENA